MAETTDAELAREGRARRRRPLAPRRALTEVVTGGAFVAAAVSLAVLAHGSGMLDAGPAIVLVAMFAAGIRLQIDVGVTYTTPVQLAFVPMLLLLPTPVVPLLVLLGWFLGRLPDLVGPGKIHPDRLLLIPADCWFAMGPALVLIGLDAQDLDWGQWPVYLLALGAQFALELIVSQIRNWIGEGIPPRLVMRELGLVWSIDGLLSPLGLLAAFAAESFAYAFLLLVPLAGLIGIYARERDRRLAGGLALSDAASDREGLIAGASHELVTPLGVLIGLTARVTSGPPLSEARRAELDTVMRREVLALRHVVRQFVDYTRLKTERDLVLRPAPTRLEPIAASVVIALTGSGKVGVMPVGRLPPAMVDPDRAHQMIMSMAAEGLEGADAVTLELATEDAAMIVVVSSPRDLRPRPFAEGGEGSDAGLGLYVTRELARAQGGELAAEPREGGGARYVLTLPVAG